MLLTETENVFCNKITPPEFTIEQIVKCQQCKYISGKKIWCCLFGIYISGKEEKRIIRPSRKIINLTKTAVKQNGCCGKAKSVLKKGKHIAIGYTNLVRGKKYEFTDSRIRICQKCDKNYWIKRTLWCRLCGCYVPAKARVPGEKCLLGKW